MAEAILWTELKASKLGGRKFVRQMPIGPYFADFVCRSAKLIVELDGSQHADSSYDRRRDEFMRAEGYSILRFWSADALKRIASVCETIMAALEGRLAEDVVSTDLRFVMAKGRGFVMTTTPSPSRCASHLSPASRGRGTQVGMASTMRQQFLAPAKRGRGGSGEARDGEGGWDGGGERDFGAQPGFSGWLCP
jgi:very-short-patch-repair endonuclease